MFNEIDGISFKLIAQGLIPMKTRVYANMSHGKACIGKVIVRVAPKRTGLTHDIRGFTLVELIVVAAILGVLALMALPAYQAYINTVKEGKGMADIRTLEKDIEAYSLDHGTLPPDLTAIGRDGLRDPWGHPYEYLDISGGGGTPYEDNATNPLNKDFDLYSKGQDGASTLKIYDSTSQDDIVRSEAGFVGIYN